MSTLLRSLLVLIACLSGAGASADDEAWPEPAPLPRSPTLSVEARLKAHEGLARCLAFSPDGALLATGGSDRSLRFWDVAARMETRKHVLPSSG